MRYWLQYWCYSCSDWRDLFKPGGELVAAATLPAATDEARRRAALGWRVRVLGPGGEPVLEM